MEISDGATSVSDVREQGIPSPGTARSAVATARALAAARGRVVEGTVDFMVLRFQDGIRKPDRLLLGVTLGADPFFKPF